MAMKARHGHAVNGKATHEYNCWAMMKRRCNAPKATGYKYYGGRGIAVCERWGRFDHFIADMGIAPTPSHTLDRYPSPDGNYEPGNVRWATKAEQAATQRKWTGPKPESVKAAISRTLKGRPWSDARRQAQVNRKTNDR